MIDQDRSDAADSTAADEHNPVGRGRGLVRLVRRRRMLLPSFLGLLVVGALADGAWRGRRPSGAAPPPGGAPVASLMDAARLRPDLDKLPLAYISEYWQQLAGEARAGLVGLGIPGEAGVVIAPGLAVSGVRSGEAVERVGGEIAGHVRLLGLDARLGLSVFEVAPEAETRALTMADPAERWAGMAVAVVGLDSDWRPMVETTSIRKSDVMQAEGGELPQIDVALPPGGATCAAVVDLDAHLIGVVLPDPASGSRRVVPTEAILEAAEDLRTGRPCRSIDASPLDPELGAALRLDRGVVVDAVFQDAFAARPDLLEGDIIISWNGVPTGSVEELRAAHDATEPAADVEALVWRGGRRSTARFVMPDRACRAPERRPHEVANVGLRVAWEGAGGGRRGYRVLTVQTGGAAEAAGLLPGDLIVAIDGRELEMPRSVPWEARAPRSRRDVAVHVYRVFRRNRPFLARVELIAP